MYSHNGKSLRRVARGASVNEENRPFWSSSQVDFDHKVVQLADAERSVLTEIQNRVHQTQEALESKSKNFNAIQKNLLVLEQITNHNEKELKLLRRQNVKLQSRYKENYEELTQSKQELEMLHEEVNFLREKIKVYEESDKERKELLKQKAALE